MFFIFTFSLSSFNNFSQFNYSHIHWHKIYYSVLNASTGSFLLAILEGINPAIIVKTTLIITKVIAPPIGNWLMFETPATALIIAFIGIFNSNVIAIPNTPAANN